MRGNTFNALKTGQIATVWEPSPWYGLCGVIESKQGIGRKGKGWVTLKFADGRRSAPLPFHKIALGDNSQAQ